MMDSKMMMIVVVVAVLFARGAQGSIGINWGRQSAQRLLPSQVVDLLLQNGIKHARVYSSEVDILSAFVGSGIQLTISIFRASLINSMDTAKAYVERNMPFFGPSSVRSVYLGGYVFDAGRDDAFLESSLKSLRMLQTALNDRGVGDQVKANFIHYELSLKPNISKPSEAEFLDQLKPAIMEYLDFIRQNHAPFPIEITPLLDVSLMHDFGLDFAFPDNKSNLVIQDINGALYTNIFEWQYDCFVWALNKLNASDINIVVSQIGWPTDGLPGATATNAERFFKHLLPLVSSNKGTPMRPGAPIDINVHALTDETKMLPAEYSRHWGIYRSNGQPKYKIDLSGQGRDIYPTTVKGIMRMPDRWCVFNGDLSDPYKVNEELKWACDHTDCSSTFIGSSCSHLTFNQNVSYAFNMFFQFQFQDEEACTFDGLATVSVDDPSTPECVFPVEVVRGRQRNYVPRPPKGFTGTV
ncbi:hypothetical protein C2S52_010895 [Perilla frutescens var. hirtella]|nr:hypothetical protein C2S52_010895 [Perilla frutescens var. hirtella]KAH6817709.1 hypothetical protein C2S51_001312 [Perilla frutescens var. frutescens]